ncbi:S-layer homology domain-containing protein [Paenibacillus sp. FJAT-27812]|uniref:S-layer homology domain-containing protein n=1 Tax=Paenibacillus sp. FJAT-27812 TaxID=1684143 RepID=UPI0006A7A2F8|nr:S-layer homology domain-containing protein [Paenibacillus sp. FJAT-27812]
MRKTQSSYTKLLVALLLSVSVIFTQSAAFAASPAAPVSQVSQVSQEDGAAQYKLFLKDKFDVSLSGKVTKGDFIKAVADILGYKPSGKEVTFSDVKSGSEWFDAAAALYEKGILSGPAIQGEQVLTTSVAVSIAVRAADLKELAYTYPEAKVNKALTKLNVKSSALGTKGAQETAAAVDTGLLTADQYANFKPKNAASEQLINTLLGKVLITKGLYKKYIGYVNDGDIFAKLSNAYNTSDIINAPKLQELVNTALKQDLITGYNIKDSRFNANFVDSLSLIYGHSDFNHAIQLIGLLRSEGLNAKVQFEPKTSAFIFLAEWGTPGPNVVKIENGNYISYSKEYDLAFEFATAADKAAFQDVILKYAKKDKADQTGLIIASWWQPLYYSQTELKDYEIITNNFITDPDSPYTVNPFSLNEDSEKVVAGLKAIDPSVNVTPIQFWVDKPFYRYLHDEAV